MIVYLKMHAAVKSYGKICLKAIGDTFSLICGLWSGEGQGTHFLGGDNIQQKGKVQTFGLVGSGCSAYCNDFGKSEWEYFFTACKVKDKKEA